jgi:hypothetical protein
MCVEITISFSSIENQHFGIMHDRLCEPDTSLEAFRQGIDGLAEYRAEVQQLDNFGEAFLSRAAAQSPDVGNEIEELRRRHFGVQRCAFWQVSDALLRRKCIGLNIVSADTGGARAWCNESRDHFHGRGLAGSVRSQEAKYFTRTTAE